MIKRKEKKKTKRQKEKKDHSKNMVNDNDSSEKINLYWEIRK